MNMIKDINNGFFYKSIIKKHKTSTTGNDLKLRVDGINRIYTVLDVKEVQDIDEFKPMELDNLVFEKSIKYNNYLESLNLAEIIIPSITKIENSDSGLLVYKFYGRGGSFNKIIFIIIIILMLIGFMIFKNNII